MKYLLSLLLISIVASCSKSNPQVFSEILKDSPFINGKPEYLSSPMVAAGDRVYMVGHQDGSFPDLGWHIKGEMGGIWNHPIKLMDGFDIVLDDGTSTFTLNKATSFTNYPYANMHTFNWKEKNIEIERWQFVPDGKEGMVVQLVIKKAPETKVKVKFTGKSDLRPTWLGERTNMIDGKDIGHWDDKTQAWFIKDSLNPWFTIFGSEMGIEKTSTSISNDNTSIHSIEKEIILSSNDVTTINYFIAGSYTSEALAKATYDELKTNWTTLLSEKKERYKKISSKSVLVTPDSTINETFKWLKYNCDWLVRTVPEIGSGIGAGLPDYPWWFGVDSEYALQGYMAIGQTEPVYNTIKLLDSVSNALNGNGRIIHEMSTNGAVFNPGNINETPQFASLIWKIYQWNGDKEFLQKYFPTIEKGLEWLLRENDANKNLFPDGFGMMEIHGMDSEMIDVAAYTQKAFDDASKIALELGFGKKARSYKLFADQLKGKINKEFWNEEFNSYADFIGTDEQALKLIDDAIVRADTLNKPWAVTELKKTREAIFKNPSQEPRPFVLHHNWVVNTPMEVGIAPVDKAIKGLNTAEQFVNPFGVFVTGIDRDDSAGSDDGSFKGSKIFSYTGAVMTLPTGVQIVAENNYGRPDNALNYLKRMTRTFSYAFPGGMYEVSPDYGMMTQAWNIYSYAVPIVEQFFGIQPDAANKRVVIKPQMPSEWDTAQLDNVHIGNNEVSVHFSNKDGKTTMLVSQTQTDWEIEIIFPKEKYASFEVQPGTIAEPNSIVNYHFVSKDKKARVTLKNL
ncbi:glycogen debranching protein [Aureisphaera sp. CAU 1614]|uniref:Glycogen debranching protein n=1 Tax=Halomarinibacterium sedimenti TaxID=2857106 RepID=A0A9X1FQ16_9FLAO|nr:glycogen debranching protein [Halomarinibacterium sedimenti]MBW2938333.1 glycogen debranching protein [Halomarinibacterium sedimenti]